MEGFMATARVTKDAVTKEEVNTGIEATVMALRETLMDYFKGGFGQRVTDNQVWRRQSDRREANHNFERRRREMENLCDIGISNVCLFSVQKCPNILTMHMNRLDRSEQLKAVREGVDNFLAKHLRGVDVVRIGKPTARVYDDTDLVLSSKPRKLSNQSNSPVPGSHEWLVQMQQLQVTPDQLRGTPLMSGIGTPLSWVDAVQPIQQVRFDSTFPLHEVATFDPRTNAFRPIRDNDVPF